MEDNPQIAIEILVEQARQGNKLALAEIIERIQTNIYNLSLRMFWHPADAEDATQEILIKVITHLSQFRGECSFNTWVYRISNNYLLTTRKRRVESSSLTFENMQEGLQSRADKALPDALSIGADSLEYRLLLEEVQLSCTLGMLLCLDREHRLTYILGELLEVSGAEGAFITETNEATFRKRLSRAREKLRNFMRGNCGIVNPANPCRCSRQLGYKMQHEKLAPNRLLFATHPYTRQQLGETISAMHELDRTVALYRRQPEFAAPKSLLVAIKHLLSASRLFENN